MRRLSIIVLLVLLLAVVVSAAFLLVPSPLQKWAVERGASLGTGRQVSFGEPFRLHAWPPLTITAADVRVANADWGRAPELPGSKRSRPGSTCWRSGAKTASRSSG